MQLYNLTNPSDTVTFYAPSYKIAFFAGLLVGEGKFAVNNRDRSEDGPLFLFGGVEEYIKKEFDTSLTEVLNDKALMEAIWAALRTFAYVGFENRGLYDHALNAITDPIAQAKFKSEQEDERRSSMNRIVAYAWQLADALEKQWEDNAKTQS